jgi:hypothetical protein
VGLSQIDRFCGAEKEVDRKLWEQVGKPLFLGARLV